MTLEDLINSLLDFEGILELDSGVNVWTLGVKERFGAVLASRYLSWNTKPNPLQYSLSSGRTSSLFFNNTIDILINLLLLKVDKLLFALERGSFEPNCENSLKTSDVSISILFLLEQDGRELMLKKIDYIINISTEILAFPFATFYTTAKTPLVRLCEEYAELLLEIQPGVQLFLAVR